MYWLKKCIFYIQPQYKIGICKTCKKVICFNKLISADPRDGLLNWKGPQKLIDESCLKNNPDFISFSSFLEKNSTKCKWKTCNTSSKCWWIRNEIW